MQSEVNVSNCSPSSEINQKSGIKLTHRHGIDNDQQGINPGSHCLLGLPSQRQMQLRYNLLAEILPSSSHQICFWMRLYPTRDSDTQHSKGKNLIKPSRKQPAVQRSAGRVCKWSRNSGTVQMISTLFHSLSLSFYFFFSSFSSVKSMRCPQSVNGESVRIGRDTHTQKRFVFSGRQCLLPAQPGPLRRLPSCRSKPFLPGEFSYQKSPANIPFHSLFNLYFFCLSFPESQQISVSHPPQFGTFTTPCSINQLWFLRPIYPTWMDSNFGANTCIQAIDCDLET